MTENETQKILKKVKMEMANKGINQSDLAKKLGLTHAAVSSWFNGKSTPNLEMLLTVFKVLDKPSNYFFAEDVMQISGSGNIAGHRGMSNIQLPVQLSLLAKDIEVIKKTLENFDLRLKILEKK